MTSPTPTLTDEQIAQANDLYRIAMYGDRGNSTAMMDRIRAILAANEAAPAAAAEGWRNDAAAVMARFVNLSSTPNKDEWAIAAVAAVRLLNSPASPSVEGAGSRTCEKHCYGGARCAQQCQMCADADAPASPSPAGQSEPVAWDALADQLDAFLWTVREFATLHHGDKHNITVGAGEAQNLLRAYRRAASPAGVQGDGAEQRKSVLSISDVCARCLRDGVIERTADCTLHLPAGRAGAEGGETATQESGNG